MYMCECGFVMRMQKPTEGAGSPEATQSLIMLGTRLVHPF